MSWSTRRAVAVLTAAAVLAGLIAVGRLQAQRRPIVKGEFPPDVMPGLPGGPPGPPKKNNIYDLGHLELPKDEEDLKQVFDFLEDEVKRAVKAGREGKIDEAGGHWVKACNELQRQLGRPADKWVPRERKNAQGQTQVLYVSVKKEAGRVVGALP